MGVHYLIKNDSTVYVSLKQLSLYKPLGLSEGEWAEKGNKACQTLRQWKSIRRTKDKP